MFEFDTMSLYAVVIALAALLATILVWQSQRTQKMVLGWMAAAILGVLLGAAGLHAVVCMSGGKLAKPTFRPPGEVTPKGPTSIDPVTYAAMLAEGKVPGTGGAPAGKGAGMPGMGGMGGPAAPAPKRDLAALVRKLELLSGDIGIALAPSQAAAVADCLKDVEKAESMSDDEAKAKYDKLLSLLDDGQKSRLAAIELPRPPRAGGPGGAGPGGKGPGGPGGPGGKGPGGPSGPGQDPLANPFKQEANAKPLDGLRQRLASKGEPEKTPPKKP